MLPDVYNKAVPMLDKYVAAVDAASVTPLFLDQSTNPVIVQSNHTTLGQDHYIVCSI